MHEHKRYGVSDVALAKACRRLGIPHNSSVSVRPVESVTGDEVVLPNMIEVRRHFSVPLAVEPRTALAAECCARRRRQIRGGGSHERWSNTSGRGT